MVPIATELTVCDLPALGSPPTDELGMFNWRRRFLNGGEIAARPLNQEQPATGMLLRDYCIQLTLIVRGFQTSENLARTRTSTTKQYLRCVGHAAMFSGLVDELLAARFR